MLYRLRGRNSAYRTGGFRLFLKDGILSNFICLLGDHQATYRKRISRQLSGGASTIHSMTARRSPLKARYSARGWEPGSSRTDDSDRWLSDQRSSMPIHARDEHVVIPDKVSKPDSFTQKSQNDSAHDAEQQHHTASGILKCSDVSFF